MPHTLLVPLVGPMQAWGSRSRFDDRDTHAEPTKSGVLGLICAALGRPRTQGLDDLNALRFGVRADAPGRAATDFHTAQNVLRAGGSGTTTVTSRRHFLADARFLCGLEGEDLAFLRQLEIALHDPVWPLSLGRKSFPLTVPPFLPNGSVREQMTLEDAFQREPCLARPPRWQSPPFDDLRLVLETPDGPVMQQDLPEDFGARRFGLRRLRVTTVTRPAEEALDVFI